MADLNALNQAEAAALLGITPRSIRDWQHQGQPIPRNADGSYPGPALVHWFANRDRDADQRQRLAAAQAEKVETENALRRGDLLDASEARQVWADHIMAARAKLLAMPAKLGPQLASRSSAEAAALIRAEVYAALRELAGVDEPLP